MRLIIIRHGPAGDKEAFAKTGKDDSLRPLTPAGKKKMKRAATSLRRLFPRIDLLATSPLKRAQQTAAIVYKVYGDKPQFIELDLLSGDGQDPARFVTWLKDHDRDDAVLAIVGHEPDLSRWASWLLTGQKKGFVQLKKGAACVIDFEKRVAGGKGMLYGLFQPRELVRANS
jgi:phosphohistidine phosphatase